MLFVASLVFSSLIISHLFCKIVFALQCQTIYGCITVSVTEMQWNFFVQIGQLILHCQKNYNTYIYNSLFAEFCSLLSLQLHSYLRFWLKMFQSKSYQISGLMVQKCQREPDRQQTAFQWWSKVNKVLIWEPSDRTLDHLDQ